METYYAAMEWNGDLLCCYDFDFTYMYICMYNSTNLIMDWRICLNSGCGSRVEMSR